MIVNSTNNIQFIFIQIIIKYLKTLFYLNYFKMLDLKCNPQKL